MSYYKFISITISNPFEALLNVFLLSIGCLARKTSSLKSKIHFKTALKNYDIISFQLLSYLFFVFDV